MEKLSSTQESLLPIILDKTDKGYLSVSDIAYRLQENDATNIALTGPYGSGKSSVLHSLMHDFPQYHYLNISLATLKAYCSDSGCESKGDNDSSDSYGNAGNEINRLIEYSILQQLIYREKQDTIPNSRFKRIYHLEKKKGIKIAAMILLAVFSLIILFEPEVIRIEWIYSLLSIKWLNVLFDSICILYLGCVFVCFLSWLLQTLSNTKLNKLNIKDGEIDLVDNTSIFNKHLDEILYFFQMTQYDVVIFEDLDRFDTVDIFLKLRELVILLNESKFIQRGGRKITFIYAVRDDMFRNSDRSKCFDYITTVIPIINRSNSKDILKEQLAKRGCSEITDKHLKELGFFINDMRLLINITNEYAQYRAKIENNIVPEKLLAMIVYKNYHPQDFANLHNCRGTVYSIIQLKPLLYKKSLLELEEQIQIQEKKKYELITNKHLKEKELRLIYLSELLLMR